MHVPPILCTVYVASALHAAAIDRYSYSSVHDPTQRRQSGWKLWLRVPLGSAHRSVEARIGFRRDLRTGRPIRVTEPAVLRYPQQYGNIGLDRNRPCQPVLR